MFWVLPLEKGEIRICSALIYSMKCIHCMCYKCRWKLKLKLDLNCLMHCVRPICRFARVVGVQNSIGAGRLYSFRVIQIYICWHGTAIYGIWKLFRFFIEIFWRILNTRLERASKWNMKHNYDLSSHNSSQFQFRAAHILNIFLLQTLPPNDLFHSSSLSFWTKTN